MAQKTVQNNHNKKTFHKMWGEDGLATYGNLNMFGGLTVDKSILCFFAFIGITFFCGFQIGASISLKFPF